MPADPIRTPPAVFRLVLESDLRRFASARKARSHFLGAIREHLEADSAWLYPFAPEPPEGKESIDGAERRCGSELMREFAEQQAPKLARDLLLAPVRINGRLTGVVGVERHGTDFELGTGRKLTRLCSLLARDLARREGERQNRVLDRIKEKVLYELRPRDLAYQILDGLEQLVDYDHSAALLTFDPEIGLFKVETERIVWAKAKSRQIGQELTPPAGMVEALQQPHGVKRLVRSEDHDANAFDRELFEMLDYSRNADQPAASGMLAAPLYADCKFLGLLKVAIWKRHPFDDHDVKVVERFLPSVAVAIRNMNLRVTLENQAIQAETRAGLVTLARAVAHDVNNAIGGILPIAEQAREDLEEREFDAECLSRDLDVIIDKARLCKRIFSNMLRVSVERVRGGPLDVNQALQDLMPMLEDQAEACGVTVDFELGRDLPPVRFSQEYLERVLWNLVNNAIEAMPGREGRVDVRTERGESDGVLLTVRDNGPGIDPEIHDRIQEPFFTTKSGGTGLGLSICRSLIWQHGGRMRIRSKIDEGTEVRVMLPAASHDAGETP